jgi:hypothetical protein
MLELLSETWRVECDADDCFESIQVTVSPDETIQDRLDLRGDWVACIDQDGIECVYCFDHMVKV